jgi:5'-deoxynucleotidase YfbR-like HD superfamily hydrolase
MGKTATIDVTMNDPRLRRLRRLHTVPRWNGVPTIKGQMVDAHSFHVMWIALWLVNRLEISKHVVTNLLIYCLLHDEPEAVTGDLPSPSKKVIGDVLKQWELSRDFAVPVDDLTRYIAKAADCLEALMFCFEEQELGNRSLEGIVLDISAKLRDTIYGLRAELSWGPVHEISGPELEEELWEIVHPQRHPVLDEINNPVEGDDMDDIPF